MKKTIKSIVGCVVFVALVLYLLSGVTEVLTPKFENRYYILEDYLEKNPEENLHDIQVFGSCHAYTSFNPAYMEEAYGVSGFVYANAGEIIPTTYARMVEQFQKHTPKVAVVEIWGINPYETYSAQEDVFGHYLSNNLEQVGSSLAKQEVIRDFQDKEFQDISLLNMNFPFMNYKDRLLDGSLTKLDFDYDFLETQEYMLPYTYKEMLSRTKNSGYVPFTSVKLKSYPQLQSTIAPDEMLEIEPDIAKYIQKIIDLCKEKNVELIFYRSPYISKVNELKKLNHFRQICDQNDVLFIDLEAEIQYNYDVDFKDYEHLSEVGANKSTEYLIPYIMEAMGQTWTKKEITRSNLAQNSDFSSNEAWKSRFDGLSLTENGMLAEATVTGAGWLIYQDIPVTEEIWGMTVTASFSIEDYAGAHIAPVVSYRNAEGSEIDNAKFEMVNGECTVTGLVSVGTEFLRVGVFAWDGTERGDFVSVDKIQLYQGAFSVETLPTVIN